jgi:hypothetical protein
MDLAMHVGGLQDMHESASLAFGCLGCFFRIIEDSGYSALQSSRNKQSGSGAQGTDFLQKVASLLAHRRSFCDVLRFSGRRKDGFEGAKFVLGFCEGIGIRPERMIDRFFGNVRPVVRGVFVRPRL